MNVTYPDYRVRVVKNESGGGTIHLIDKRGRKVGDGVPASSWEIVMWDELEETRLEVATYKEYVRSHKTVEV